MQYFACLKLHLVWNDMLNYFSRMNSSWMHTHRCAHTHVHTARTYMQPCMQHAHPHVCVHKSPKCAQVAEGQGQHGHHWSAQFTIKNNLCKGIKWLNSVLTISTLKTFGGLYLEYVCHCFDNTPPVITPQRLLRVTTTDTGTGKYLCGQQCSREEVDNWQDTVP